MPKRKQMIPFNKWSVILCYKAAWCNQKRIWPSERSKDWVLSSGASRKLTRSRYSSWPWASLIGLLFLTRTQVQREGSSTAEMQHMRGYSPMIKCECQSPSHTHHKFHQWKLPRLSSISCSFIVHLFIAQNNTRPSYRNSLHYPRPQLRNYCDCIELTLCIFLSFFELIKTFPIQLATGREATVVLRVATLRKIGNLMMGWRDSNLGRASRPRCRNMLHFHRWCHRFWRGFAWRDWWTLLPSRNVQQVC